MEPIAYVLNYSFRLGLPLHYFLIVCLSILWFSSTTRRVVTLSEEKRMTDRKIENVVCESQLVIAPVCILH